VRLVGVAGACREAGQGRLGGTVGQVQEALEAHDARQCPRLQAGVRQDQAAQVPRRQAEVAGPTTVAAPDTDTITSAQVSGRTRWTYPSAPTRCSH
jgi:hypothetical protein